MQCFIIIVFQDYAVCITYRNGSPTDDNLEFCFTYYSSVSFPLNVKKDNTIVVIVYSPCKSKSTKKNPTPIIERKSITYIVKCYFGHFILFKTNSCV